MRWALAAALAVLAGVALLKAGGGGGSTEPSRSATPTRTAATPSPEVTATPTPAALHPLDWRSSEHTGQPLRLVRARSGFLGVETRAVASLRGSGSFRWRSKGPRTDDFRGLVAGGVPVTGPRRGAVKGLDPRTGRVRWSHPSTKYVFTDGRRVYAPTCTGAQTGVLGECTITAYDPRTGAARWSIPAYANVEQSQTGSGVLVVQTFPTGGGPRFLVLDPASGATRATIDIPRGHFLTLAGRHLVDAGESSPPVRSGCKARLTGYGLDGAVAWRRALKLGRDRSKRCDSYLAHDVGGDVALGALEGRALLLDPATGRTIWTGPRGAHIDGKAGGHLVVGLPDRQRALGVDVRAGRTAWTYRGITGPWVTWRGYAATNVRCEPGGKQCTVVLDGRTGRELLRVPGVPQNFVPGPRPGLMTRIDSDTRYAARYGFVTLPAG